jgi:hypothetical protein
MMSDNQGNNDRAAELFTLLRASTQKMLGLSTPTPVQQLKVDLAASLRMEIDRIVSQQLAGNPADVRALTALTESLRSLFPVAADPGHDFSGAREELERFLADRASRIETREVRESARLREENARLVEENARLLRALRQSGSEPRPAAPPVDNVVPLDAPKPKHRPWSDHYDESHGANSARIRSLQSQERE